MRERSRPRSPCALSLRELRYSKAIGPGQTPVSSHISQTSVALARKGAGVILAGRSEERHRDVLAQLLMLGARVTYLELDLADLRSVRTCAERFLALNEPLSVLVNNAGLAGSRSSATVAREGSELASATHPRHGESHADRCPPCG
jgi:NAD(P)-dependent dehydrogenase (short-subunit alcohol dehydrogenase family)